MRIRLLGTVELVGPDGDVVAVSALKRRVVLAALAVRLGSPVSVDRLIDTVWERDPPPQARTAIHVHMSALRKMLTSDLRLETRPGGYQLVGDRSSVDMFEFEDLMAGARDMADEDAIPVLRAALRLWRGAALADVPVPELQETVAVRLEVERLAALEALATRAIRVGRATEVLLDLAEAVDHDPTHEPLVECLMLALHAAGRQAEALALYDRTRRQLADTLGVGPGARLRDAYAVVLNNQPVGPPTGRPSQLPRAVSRFVGRTEALAWLDGVVDDASSRMVVITGAAGVGKTALAIHWAHRVAGRFPGGHLHVDLHGFDDADPSAAETVLQSVLTSLGASGDELPHDAASLASVYRHLIAPHRMLIILDNARDAEQVQPLLPAGSDSVVVVTSRHRLDSLVVHERASTLALDVLSEPESVSLLGEVLGPERLDREPAAVRRLVELCERLPLALRIAGARLAGQPGIEIADLVADLDDEHQRLATLSTPDSDVSMAASLAATERALPAPAARLFRLLAVYPGIEIDPGAAAALADVPPAVARRALAALAAVHLMARTDESRYVMSDLVRRYAADVGQAALTEDERHRAVGRLTRHYAAMAANARDALTQGRRAAPEFDGPAAALAWFTVAEPVIRALVTRADEFGQLPAAISIIEDVTELYTWQGDSGRFVALCRTVAGAAHDDLGSLVSLRCLGTAFTDAHRVAAAVAAFDEAMRLVGRLPDPTIIAARLVRIGLLRLIALHQPAGAAPDDDLVAGSVVTEAEDPYLAATRLWLLGVACAASAPATGSLDLVEKAQAIADRHGIESLRHQVEFGRALVLMRAGEHRSAAEVLRDAATRADVIGDVRTQAWCLDALARAQQRLGEPYEAETSRAAELYRRLGITPEA